MPYADPEQAKAYMRGYRQRNKAKIQSQIKAWKHAHPERIAELNREYNARPEVKQAKREHQRRNRRKIYAAHRVWRLENAERLAAERRANAEFHRAKARAYYAANSERIKNQIRVAEGRRRAQKLATCVVDFTAAQLEQRLSMYAGCWMCGGPKEAVDHVKPLAKGGSHMLCNLRPACKSCNSRKGATWPL